MMDARGDVKFCCCRESVIRGNKGQIAAGTEAHRDECMRFINVERT